MLVADSQSTRRRVSDAAIVSRESIFKVTLIRLGAPRSIDERITSVTDDDYEYNGFITMSRANIISSIKVGSVNIRVRVPRHAPSSMYCTRARARPRDRLESIKSN